MSDPYLMAAALGFGGGIVAVLVLGGAYLAYRRLESPGRRAGIRRAVKFLGFWVVGWVLGNAAYIVVTALAHVAIDPVTAQVFGAAASSLSAGVQKSRSWVEASAEYGIEPQSMTVPTIEARSMVAPQDPTA